MDAVLITIMVIAASWAVYTDFKYRRISNLVTFGAAGVALVVRLSLGGTPAVLMGLGGWLLGAGLLIVPFALGWMGAGDVKLLAAFGAIGGPNFVLYVAVMAGLAGGVMSLFYLAREGKLWFTLRNIFIFIRHPFNCVLPISRRMPFGPALALGAAASVVLGKGLL